MSDRLLSHTLYRAAWCAGLLALTAAGAAAARHHPVGLGVCVLIGAFWTYLFVLTRNLWVVAANHAAWNFTIILSGTPLSGIDSWQAVAPIESSYHGPFWLTGGLYGPEDSIVTLSVVILCLLVQRVWHRKQDHARAAFAPAPLTHDRPLWRDPHA